MTKGVARVLHGIRAVIRENVLRDGGDAAANSVAVTQQSEWLQSSPPTGAVAQRDKRHRRVPVRPCAPRLRACLASAVAPVIDAGGCEWV